MLHLIIIIECKWIDSSIWMLYAADYEACAFDLLNFTDSVCISMRVHQFLKLVNSKIIRTSTHIYGQNDTISWTDYFYPKKKSFSAPQITVCVSSLFFLSILIIRSERVRLTVVWFSRPWSNSIASIAVVLIRCPLHRPESKNPDWKCHCDVEL